MATKLLYRVNETCDALAISRSLFYRLVAENKIRTVKIVGGTRVPASEVERFLSELETVSA